jgi:hypothetical protein
MLAEALQAEVDDYVARFSAERDENGRQLVVRNGSHRPREVLTSAGAVEVTAPPGKRPACGSRDGRASSVRLGDPASVVS